MPLTVEEHAVLEADATGLPHTTACRPGACAPACQWDAARAYAARGR